MLMRLPSKALTTLEKFHFYANSLPISDQAAAVRGTEIYFFTNTVYIAEQPFLTILEKTVFPITKLKVPDVCESPVAKYLSVIAKRCSALIGCQFQHLFVNSGLVRLFRCLNLSGDILMYLKQTKQTMITYNNY